MKYLWKNKIFQGVVFVIIAASIGIFNARINIIQFLIDNSKETTMNGFVRNDLLSNISIIEIFAWIIWAVASGVYINYIYSLNHPKEENEVTVDNCNNL